MTKVYTIDPLRMGYMSMFGTLIAFLRLLLPFLKESVLANATFKEWLKENIINVIWIILMMGMLCVVVYLFDTVAGLRRENDGLNHQLDTAKIQLGELQKRYDMLNGEYAGEKKHSEDLEKQTVKLSEENTILGSKINTYENWLHHWDVDINYRGSGYPALKMMAAPKPRPVTPKHPTSPAIPEDDKSKNQDQHRNIFQRIRDWGKDHL